MYGLGARAATPDPRDHPYRAARAAAAASSNGTLPLDVDYRTICPPILDQGKNHTCVGMTVASYAMFQLWKPLGYLPKLSTESIHVLARRRYDEWPGEDYIGTSLPAGLKVADKDGVHLASDWPTGSLSPVVPESVARKNARRFRLRRYDKLEHLDPFQVKHAIHNLGAVMATVIVDQGWEERHEKRIVRSGRELGVHTIMIVGYHDGLGAYVVRNSWSERWKDKGYALLNYADLPKITYDMWVATVFPHRWSLSAILHSIRSQFNRR